MGATLRDSTTTAPRADTAGRFVAIDILRGAVMVLMAIDHVRVYSGLPAGGPAPGIFFTRWITHFCAPAFVFLAGTAAFLHGRKLGDTRALARFLVIRGAWLILLEMTVIRVSWTFNLDYGHYLLAGVIWVIGWSMIVLAALVRLPVKVIAAFGIIIIAGHNVMDFFAGRFGPALQSSPFAWVAQVLYAGGPIRLGENGPVLGVLYSLIPWVGVMAAGYAFGTIIVMEPARRRRACLTIGLGAVALFLVLRGFNLYGNPSPWPNPHSPMPALLQFINTNKYPASFLFLLMTLGPAIALIPVLEKAHGPLARALVTFGRVPLFFYLLHIPLIHALALVVSQIRLGAVSPWLFTNHPYMPAEQPEGYTWSLPLLYLVWGIAIVILYAGCRWFAEVKARRRDAWLTYL
jgi:uncharacterized membrane protein